MAETPNKSTKVAQQVAAKAGKPRTTAPKSQPSNAKPEFPPKLIDARIKELGDWRGKTLSRVRALIKQADPDVVEALKWRKPSNRGGVPAWSHDGIICTGETYKDKVKSTFFQGASLEDPAGLFNAGFGGGTRRAIDLREGDEIDERAFKSLVRSAVALNASAAPATSKGTASEGERSTATKGKGPAAAAKPKLLAGGNPQIAKADGDAPAQAYIAAMPGWKRNVGRRLDTLIVRTVPDVRKAVRWNSPFYGVEGRGWFLSYHCFTKYVNPPRHVPATRFTRRVQGPEHALLPHPRGRPA
jgi:hypothetical protein